MIPPEPEIEPGTDPAADRPLAPIEPLTPIEPLAPGAPLTPTEPRPGTSTFTIEGRAAPALFVVGWLTSLLGLGALLISGLSSGGSASAILLIVSLVLLMIGLIAAAGSQGLERRARGTLPYRGPSPVLIFAAVVPLIVLAGLLVGLLLTALSIPVAGPLGRFLGVLVTLVAYVLVIRLLVADPGALTWSEMGVRRFDRAAMIEIGSGALWAIPVVAATSLIALALHSFIAVTPDSPLPPAGTGPGFVLNLIGGMILAPYGEELLFRGVATTAWVRGLGVGRGIVAGAVFFAFVHVVVDLLTASNGLQLAIVGFTTRLPVAFALGYLFVKGYSLRPLGIAWSSRTGSLWVPFGLHAAFNGILLILAEVAIRAA